MQNYAKDAPKASPKVLTGMPELDKILTARNLDVAAKKLEDFISKRKMDRRTVWQGLPGILSTIFGGGIQHNTHSWFDAIRLEKRPNIRCKYSHWRILVSTPLQHEQCG